jgi:Skp family chaperone for outer membrane proteins
MKITLITPLLAGLLLLGSFPTSGRGQSAQKIAIINLKTVFEGYFKTKAADATLKERAGEFDREKKALVDQYQKLTGEYKIAIEDANNQAISGDERDKRKKTAEGKLFEVREMEQTIQQFDRQAVATLDEQERRLRDKILEEIQVLVNEQAIAGEYSIVFDVASESRNRTPVILFSNGRDDLTDPVLKALNAKAPPGLATTEAKPDTAK